MTNYILFTLFFLTIGMQLGVFFTLRENDLTKGKAFIHSLVIYILPMLIIVAHIFVWVRRKELIEALLKEKNVEKERAEEFKNKMTSFKCLVYVLKSLIAELIIPFENIKTTIDVAINYERKLSREGEKARTKVKESIGLIGILKQFLKSVSNTFVHHAIESPKINGKHA